MNEKFKGLYAATIVPLKKNRQINIIELKNHLKDIVNKKNIKGLLINGHAGENFSLTDKEQIVIVKIAKKIIKKNQLIVSGVNFEDPYKARVVAKEMEKNGADAILIFPPFSWSFSRSQDQIFDHHKIIHDFISIPIFTYQSSIHSNALNYEKILNKRFLTLKKIIGVKEGSWNVRAYQENYNLFKNNKKNFLVMASGDEHLYPCFKYGKGSDGSLVSLAIILPEDVANMINLIKEKKMKEAKYLSQKINLFAEAIYGNNPASFATARLKYCLKKMKKISTDFMRSTIELDSNDKKNLDKILSKFKLINY